MARQSKKKGDYTVISNLSFCSNATESLKFLSNETELIKL